MKVPICCEDVYVSVFPEGQRTFCIQFAFQCLWHYLPQFALKVCQKKDGWMEGWMEEKGEFIFSMKTIYRMSDFQIKCYLEYNLLAIRTCCCLYFLVSPVASLCECLPLWLGTQPWLCPISCRWKWQWAISRTGLQLTSFYLPSYVSTIILRSMFSSHRCPFSLS